MEKATAILFLRELILRRFAPGPERQRWLTWLTEISQAEEILENITGLLIDAQGDEPPARLN